MTIITIQKYGMKQPGKKPYSPIPSQPNRSIFFIVLSMCEIAIVGPFAAIPLLWSIAYYKSAKTNPTTPLCKTSQTAVITTGVIGIVLALGVTFLYLLIA